MYWNDIFENFDFLMSGLVVTIQLALLAVIGSLLCGIVFGVLRHSKIPVISFLAGAYIEFTRSIPLILFIVFIHFGFLPLILGEASTFFQSACVALIAFTSAYVAEIVRSGLNSIDKGHIEAAKSLGLNWFDRMTCVILPIALTRMTPALVSQFISLIKDTSLASTIGLIEFTRSGEIIYERTYHELEILIFIALTYFAICYSLSLLSKKLESKPYINKDSENLKQLKELA